RGRLCFHGAARRLSPHALLVQTTSGAVAEDQDSRGNSSSGRFVRRSEAGIVRASGRNRDHTQGSGERYCVAGRRFRSASSAGYRQFMIMLVEPEAAEILKDPAVSAQVVGLRYVSDETPGIKRESQGKSFRYRDAKGKLVRDEETLGRIKSLVIPPAW